MTGAVHIPIASTSAIATPSVLVSRSTISSPSTSNARNASAMIE